jgi:hypothetical protein
MSCDAPTNQRAYERERNTADRGSLCFVQVEHVAARQPALYLSQRLGAEILILFFARWDLGKVLFSVHTSSAL